VNFLKKFMLPWCAFLMIALNFAIFNDTPMVFKDFVFGSTVITMFLLVVAFYKEPRRKSETPSVS
jgi:hypothetical protein